jgi:cardiolipin synthase A/B
MSYRIFTTSEQAWAAMLTDIATARTSVYIQMYILEADVHGKKFVAELEAAAKRGARVIILLDSLGSMSFPSEASERLRSAGAEILFYSFFFQRMHRKILIVDERIAFVGGVNIAKAFASWKDLQVRLTGRAIRSMLRSFGRVYVECGGKGVVPVPAGPHPGLSRGRDMRFIEHRSVGRIRELRRYYVKQLQGARESIVMVTPYLLPPRWLLAQIHQALLRGIKVEFLIPATTDHAFSSAVNRIYAPVLTRLGARCFVAPSMNHAKAMLIDGKEGIIGSQNLDLLSFDWNIEAGVFFEDSRMVQELSEIIIRWKAESVPFEASAMPAHWFDGFLRFFLKICTLVPWNEGALAPRAFRG